MHNAFRSSAAMALYLAMFLSLATALAGAQTVAATDWELSDSRKGVDFFLRDMPGSHFPEFKAVARMEGSIASVLAVLIDVERYPEWIHQCREALRLAADGSQHQYVYQLNDLPFARDRDMIMRASLSHRDQGRVVRIDLQAVPDYCQTHSDPACSQIDPAAHLRIQEAVGSYRMTQVDANTVEVIWQQHLDPGGRLPGWLVKRQMSAIPVNTLSALREQIQRPEYQNKALSVEDDALQILPKGSVLSLDGRSGEVDES